MIQSYTLVLQFVQKTLKSTIKLLVNVLIVILTVILAQVQLIPVLPAKLDKVLTLTMSADLLATVLIRFQ